MSGNNKPKESDQMAPEIAFIFNFIRFIASLIPLGIMHTTYIGGTLVVLLTLAFCDGLENFIDKSKIIAYIPLNKRETKYAKIWKIWIKFISILSFTACGLGLAIMAFKMGNIENMQYELVLLSATNSFRLFANLIFLGVIIWKKNK